VAELNKEKIGTRETISRVTIVASIFIILLAFGALFWPRGESVPHRDVLLILDPAADSQRIQELYQPLLSLLARADGQGLHLEVSNNLVDFQNRADRGARYVLCPDRIALGFGDLRYVPLVIGRRAAPRNLRPQGALVYRKSPGVGLEHWQNNYGRVIAGDSLSLLISENLVVGWGVLGAVGPDPYNHGPALHALRLADFDYALVRQWDAQRFFESGLLLHEEWGIDLLGDPWPGLILMADAELATSRRVKTAEALAAIGRDPENVKDSESTVINGLKLINLVGFNHLLEPDFDLVRKRAKENWPPRSN
jgi:hypothetical protein